MRSSPILLAVLTIVASSCAGSASAPTDAGPGQPLQLAVGEAVTVSGSTERVRLIGVNDSRCPSDVVCVTAGDAAIALELSGAGAARSDTIYLVRQPRSVRYGAYRFGAVDVQPFPRSQNPRHSNSTVTLSISRD